MLTWHGTPCENGHPSAHLFLVGNKAKKSNPYRVTRSYWPVVFGTTGHLVRMFEPCKDATTASVLRLPQNTGSRGIFTRLEHAQREPGGPKHHAPIRPESC